MNRKVTPLASRALKGGTFNGGLWSTTRSIAGQPIRFEAPTYAELMDVVDLAVQQHMNALNVQARQQAAAATDEDELAAAMPFGDVGGPRLIDRLTSFFRPRRADPGATGGQPMPPEGGTRHRANGDRAPNRSSRTTQVLPGGWRRF